MTNTITSENIHLSSSPGTYQTRARFEEIRHRVHKKFLAPCVKICNSAAVLKMKCPKQEVKLGNVFVYTWQIGPENILVFKIKKKKCIYFFLEKKIVKF